MKRGRALATSEICYDSGPCLSFFVARLLTRRPDQATRGAREQSEMRLWGPGFMGLRRVDIRRFWRARFL